MRVHLRNGWGTGTMCGRRLPLSAWASRWSLVTCRVCLRAKVLEHVRAARLFRGLLFRLRQRGV